MADFSSATCLSPCPERNLSWSDLESGQPAEEESRPIDRLLSRCVRRVRTVLAALIQVARLNLVAYLTFILLVWFAPGFGYHAYLVIGLCLGGAVYRPLIWMPVFWFALAAVQGMGIYLTWYVADNHKFLMAYWCLALGCSWAVPEERRSALLTANARLLLGLCMAFAVGWKLLTPAFVDGSFFRFTLLSDPRFKYVACGPGGLSLETWKHNRELGNQLIVGHLSGVPVETVQLSDTSRLRLLATGMTWWTLAIEGGLAVLFLWPGYRGRIQRWRHGSLLVFLYSTYAIAPVVGFGWLLVILGLAQAPESSRKLRAAYLGAFLLIPLYALPYQRVLHGLLFS
jgi:hypothetical protein